MRHRHWSPPALVAADQARASAALLRLGRVDARVLLCFMDNDARAFIRFLERDGRANRDRVVARGHNRCRCVVDHSDVAPNEKRCATCLMKKSLSDFYRHNGGRNGRAADCKQCCICAAIRRARCGR